MPSPARESPGRREAAKQETREALIRAGVAEFAERGLQAPSLDAICARAGFTRGAFYVHFRDREDFIAAAMDHLLGAVLDAVIATGDGARDLAETVDRFAGLLALRDSAREARAETAETPGPGALPLHRVLEACEGSPELATRLVGLLGEARQRLVRAAAEGREAGSVRGDVEPDPVASLLLIVALGALVAQDLALPVDVDAVRAAVRTLLAGPTAQPGAEGTPPPLPT
jgi:AcrR family transcriptional regulator